MGVGVCVGAGVGVGVLMRSSLPPSCGGALIGGGVLLWFRNWWCLSVLGGECVEIPDF